ncbi:MAG: phosphomannomutase/phosphoglucomutase [Herbinix sp.]|nr:phosphomannomutase/phosphoglucomutase [Herbinix sp.]
MSEPKDSFLKLQNGSDVRGIAIDGVYGEDVNLTPEIVKSIAWAFAVILAEKSNKTITEIKIGVGHDSRLSGISLKNGVIDGLLIAGCQVYDCGLASTPAMFMGTIFEDIRFDGSIMITASHLPFNRNGLKFFDKNGGLNSIDIKEILTKAPSVNFSNKIQKNEVKQLNLIEYYSRFLREKIKQEVNSKEYEQPLKGLKVVLDAGNGAGGFFAEQVLLPLGADISGSQFLEPDGSFPNHIPNPEDKKAMESIQKATLDNKADLGIIFDTDVDRAGVVFSNGQEINRNLLIGLTTAITAKEHPNTTIVTDSVTSDQLTQYIEESLAMKHHRFKRGYKNVINEAIRLNNEGIETHVAIETSGHCAFKENYFLDDGAYLSVKVLVEAAKCKTQGKSIETMVEALKEPLESKEFRLKIKDENFKAYGTNVLKEFEAYAVEHSDLILVPNNYEGIRISFNDSQASGWLLLRMSLHDPLMPLNIEVNNEGGIQVIIDRILPFFEKQMQLDISSLK